MENWQINMPNFFQDATIRLSCKFINTLSFFYLKTLLLLGRFLTLIRGWILETGGLSSSTTEANTTLPNECQLTNTTTNFVLHNQRHIFSFFYSLFNIQLQISNLLLWEISSKSIHRYVDLLYCNQHSPLQHIISIASYNI